MKNRITTYLGIALTTYCNYQCFYCKEGGESISKAKQTIPFEKIKKIILNAYEIGISNFRITGGEPTSVSYFGELIEYIMSFDKSKVRINTNGFKILEYVDVLRRYKERLDVVFSVDSMLEYLDKVKFPKYLSLSVMETTKKLKENEISVRYNIVVTRINENEVRELILKAIDEMHVNVKLLDLNKFSEYLGNGKAVYNEDAFELWKNLFVPMKNFYSFLEEISNNVESEWTTQMIGKGHGIPMSTYFRNENWIQVKDSCRRAKYSDFCKEKCEHYKKGNCQEGVFSLFLSSNLTLHLSGCKNETIYFDLNKCEDAQIKIAFSKLLSLI